MKQLSGTFCLVITLLATARSKANSVSQRTRDVTNIVSLSSLSEEENTRKETLDEVDTYAELKHDPHASLQDSLTICSTIMTTGGSDLGFTAFFTILDNDRAQFLAPISVHEVEISSLKIYHRQGASAEIIGKIPPVFPNQWTRGCMAINTTSGMIHWVVEGTLVMSNVLEEVKNSRSRPRDLERKLVLGARSYSGLWQAASNKVTNLNIFSSALSVEKMKRMTGEESCVEDGDYLAWGDMEWILHGKASMETVDKGELCKGEPNVNLYYTPFLDMDVCMHHCENLGTRVPSVASSQDWAELKRSLSDKRVDTLRLWLPVDDRKTEGEWRDFYTGGVMKNYTPPWIGSGPDGGRRQNCAYLMNGDIWGDAACDSPNFACMCTSKPYSGLKLKGLCPGSSIDINYKPASDFSNSTKLRLQGLKRTLITYDNKEKIWILTMKDSNVTGISRASHASFTLGKHNWTIKGDKGCKRRKPHVRELKMSGCPNRNFTCNDGQCVSMDQRCNQLPDCRDKSDERNCKILVLEEGYNKNVPPVNSKEPVVNVSISIDLLELVDIDEEDYSIEIQFEIMLNWMENRATYNNLKKTDALNALTQDDILKLWLPEVIYENTDQKESTRLGDGTWEWKTIVVVRREEENGTMSGPESVDETEVFSGSENSLVMNQTYTHTFQCNYELSHYPFDTQVH